MPKTDHLAEFGRFVVTQLRDSGIDHLDTLLGGGWKAPSLRKLQRQLTRMPAEQRALVRRAFIEAMDAAVHDFLFALQEESDLRGRVTVRVAGKDVAKLSDGLHGEPFGDDGWYARFSKHGHSPSDA